MTREGVGRPLGLSRHHALGRQEDWEDSPERYPQTPANVWISRHDEYHSTAGSEAVNALAAQVARARSTGQTRSSG